jgi:hypothetical protein
MEIIKKGKYTFKIKKNIQEFRERILIHTYKIGGDYDDCVNISYIYDNNNKPMKAKIPHLLYEPECSIGSNLNRGGGTELMIKTIIEYAHKDVPSINIFEFTDNSHIDCIEKDLSKSPSRKAIRPLNLAFFSIAYHDYTWYELRFNAEMIDNIKYKNYRKKVSFLTEPKMKPEFSDFLKIIKGSIESIEQISYLEKLYSKSETYRDFFEAIPKSKRCDILFSWLTTFMKYYIGDYFSDKDWFIDVNTMNIPKKNNMDGGTYKNMNYRIYSYNNRQNL